jgi:uncharacterized membrane protein
MASVSEHTVKRASKSSLSIGCNEESAQNHETIAETVMQNQELRTSRKRSKIYEDSGIKFRVVVMIISAVICAVLAIIMVTISMAPQTAFLIALGIVVTGAIAVGLLFYLALYYLFGLNFF